MQTINRAPNKENGQRDGRRWTTVAVPVAIVAFIGLSILAIFNKWAVLAVALTALVVGLAIWAWRKGFRAFEVVAFLIHFDGLEFSIFSVGRLASVVLTVIFIRRILIDHWRPRAIPVRNWLPVWALFSWFMVGGMWSARAGGWLKAVLMLYLGIVFFGVTSMLIESHKDLQRFLRAYFVGGLFGSAAGILALFLRTRSQGLMGDPNFFGLVQASLVPLTVYYYRNSTDRTHRRLYLLALAVVLAGAAGAGSRSGLLGGAVVIILTMVTKPGVSLQKRFRIGAIALIVAPIAFLIGFVANPANLERGFSDRGAGRLDFWTTTEEIINDRPLFGQGPGQVAYQIPQRELITPGVQEVNETRETVSSHNTWLDIAGDSGLVGLALFAACFVVAIVSLARPRWPYMSDVSTTLLVMFAPVFTASMFLPLMNNKLAWSLIGMAAALSVPSRSARWPDRINDPPTSRSRHAAASLGDGPSPQLALPVGESSSLVPIGSAVPLPGSLRPQQILADPFEIDRMPDIDLARWDLRITRAMWKLIVSAVAVVMVVVFVGASWLPHTYSATTVLLAPDVGRVSNPEQLQLPVEASQRALVLIKSELYASNLIELSGIDRSISDVLDSIDVTKPKMGGTIQVVYSDLDRAVVEQAAPFMVEALGRIYTSSREFAAQSLDNQVRPMNPGEQYYYDGPSVLAVVSDPAISDQGPRRVWLTLTSGLATATIAMGVCMLGARRPRVSNDDDIEAMTGLPLVGHVAVGGRDPIESIIGQVNQLAVTITEMTLKHAPLRRIVIAPPTTESRVRDVMLDLAAALVSQGDRVVLVDADVERLDVARRLTPGGASPGPDEPLDLQSVEFDALPRESKLLMTGLMGEVRSVRGSQLFDPTTNSIDPTRLGELDHTVTVIVLAPPATSQVGVGALLQWSQIALVPMRTGVTTTADATLATSRVALFGAPCGGTILINS